MLLLKSQVTEPALKDLVTRIAKHAYSRNGVLTNIKSFRAVELGFGIKQLEAGTFSTYLQGQLVQMNMMATHNINMELHYLNKDRLLHWLLVKHRDTEYGFECVTESDSRYLLSKLPESSFPFEDGKDDDDDCDGYGEEQKQETSSVDQQ